MARVVVAVDPECKWEIMKFWSGRVLRGDPRTE